MCIHVGAHPCVHVGVRGHTVDVALCFLNQNLSLTWTFPKRLGWLSRKLQGFTLLCLPKATVTGLTFLHLGSGDETQV